MKQSDSSIKSIIASYISDAFNRRLHESNGTATIPYGYDSNGSLISQASSDSSRTQTWDLRGRLSGATVHVVTTSYRYTPDGIRSSVTENGSTIDYLVDGMTPMYSQAAQLANSITSGIGSVAGKLGEINLNMSHQARFVQCNHFWSNESEPGDFGVTINYHFGAYKSVEFGYISAFQIKTNTNVVFK